MLRCEYSVMTITKDEMAVWVFYLTIGSDNITNTIKILLSLNILLKCLEEEKLLIPSEVVFLGKKGANRKIKLTSENGTDSNTIRILESLNQLENDITTPVLINGQTKLYIDQKDKFIEGILTLEIDFNLVEPRFILSTYSDCWVPIDIEDNLQIDLALDSSERLERCINKMGKKIQIRERYPNENEDSDDMYILPMRGNRIYTKSYAPLLENNKEALKYLWKNREVYPS